MGQAWCKEKSTKAQDSKSPLDRVFLRCAHRIYPALKEEGSVLGGATQRVTSSEIGYASSPPRELLTRGQSIDSVDRPFHPSDWVDVNLEVPGTPRASSVMTNLTLDTALYPSSTLPSRSSGGWNPRESMPVPPPRRRRKNRGRPLPPKPDQMSATHVDRLATPKRASKESTNTSHEHVYSSVKSRDPTRSNKMGIYEHKVNGTGRVIPSTVVAGNRSNREKSSRRCDDQIGVECPRPKNTSTVSLPNYSELNVASEKNSQGEDDEVLKIHKITSAESLPALVTGGVAYSGDDVNKNEDHKTVEKFMESNEDKYENEGSIDEIDFSFDVSKNLDTLNYIYKLKGPRLSSTPVKNGFENDSRTPTTVGGWLHQDRHSQSAESVYRPGESNRERNDSENDKFFDCTKNLRNDTFFEDVILNESEDNRGSVEQRFAEPEPGKPRRRSSLKRTLSNESEPFDSYEEKELRETASTAVRSNSRLELVDRSISEESLPEEMIVDRDPTNPLGKDVPSQESYNKIEKPVALASIMEKCDDTKTPPPSPEPKIKPDIFDNDHSTLLKVLRDEAEESNLSSMTPSLTELEAALSDMLERDDENQSSVKLSEEKEKVASIENTQTERAIEAPIEPKIVQMDIDNDNRSRVSVSLKNILGGPDDRKRRINNTVESETSNIDEIDPRNGDSHLDHEGTRKSIGKNSADDGRSGGGSPTEPPEKPSRLYQINVGESSEVLEKVPTPPRRRNRGSVGAVRDNFRQSIERVATPENPYPNDRLI